MRRIITFFIIAAMLLCVFPIGMIAQDAPTEPISRGTTPVGVNPHLYHAECGARWLIDIANEPSPGHYKWYVSDLYPTTYSLDQTQGASGIGKFFLKLYWNTGNSTYLEYAEGAARWMISLAEVTAVDAVEWPTEEGGTNYSPDYYGGSGAIIDYLLLLYQETGNATYLEYAEKGANHYIDIAITVGDGYKWEKYPGFNFNFTGWFHGTAGIAYVFGLLYQETLNATYLEYCEGPARWLISIANGTNPGEYNWVRLETDANPNFSWCGGTVGIVEYFIEMYLLTSNTTYLDYANGGAAYLINESMNMGPGMVSIEYTNIFCHGDPSSSYVLYMLYNVTGNATHLQYAQMLHNWVISNGMVVNEDEIKWTHLIGGTNYITGLLMGNSGIGMSFLYGHTIEANETLLNLSIKIGNWVENKSTEVSPGVMKWNHEETIDVDEEYCTGWYWGVAGIGMFLLDLIPYWEAPPVNLEVVTEDLEGEGEPSQTVCYEIEIKSLCTGLTDISLNIPDTGDWVVEVEFDGSSLTPSETRTAYVNVTVPANALADTNMSFELLAYCDLAPDMNGSIAITTHVLQVHGVQVLTSDQVKTADVGETVQFIVPVQNTGNGVQDISQSGWAHPKDWGYEFSYDPFTFQPGEVRNFTLNITVGPNATGGYNLTMEGMFRSVWNQSTFVTTNLSVVVGLDVDIGLSCENTSVSVDPGETAFFFITVSNLGNSDDEIELWTENSTGFPEDWMIELGSSGVVYQNKDKVVPLMITLPDSAFHPQTGEVTVWARSGNDASVLESITLEASVRLTYDMNIKETNWPHLNEPGPYSIGLLITNHGSAIDSFSLNLEGIPERFEPKLVYDGHNLTPGEVRDAMLSFSIPLNTTPFVSPDGMGVHIDVVSIGAGAVTDDLEHEFTFIGKPKVELSPTKNQSGKPRSQVIYDLQVRNLGGMNVTWYSTHTTIRSVPDDDYAWTHDLDQVSLGSGHIFRGETGTLQYTVELPYDAVAGSYIDITLSLGFRSTDTSPQTYYSYTNKITFRTTVLPSYELNLSTEKYRIETDPGKSHDIHIMLRNDGNAEFLVNLTLFKADSIDASLSRSTILLGKSGSGEVILTVIAPLEPGTYPLTIQGEGATQEEALKITLVVEEETTPTDGSTTSNNNSLLWGVLSAIAGIILLILIILIVLILVTQKKKEEPDEEPEDEDDVQVDLESNDLGSDDDLYVDDDIYDRRVEDELEDIDLNDEPEEDFEEEEDTDLIEDGDEGLLRLTDGSGTEDEDFV